MKYLRYLSVLVLLLVPASVFAEAASTEAAYSEASNCYHEVKRLPAGQQSRAKWHKCITLFTTFSKKYPKALKAPNAFFSTGLAYRRLYTLEQNEDDAADAVKNFNNLVRMYPKSRLADDALFNIGTLKQEVMQDSAGAKKAMTQIISWYPNSDMAAKAKAYLSNIGDKEDVDEIRQHRRPSKYVQLKDIKKSTAPTGELVKLSLTGPVKFKTSQDPHVSPNFDIFTIELENTYLSRVLDTGYSYVGKGIIRDISPVQITRKKAAMKIVIRKKNHCRVSQKNASLNVICSKGAPQKTPTKIDIPVTAVAVKAHEVRETESSPQIEEKRLSIVIDAGHGGKDLGAVGIDGAQEKDIALQIAKRLGWQLRNKLNADVNYTRIDDKFVSLDDRTTIATGFDADLFISIHTNAAESRKLDGYQTFFLNNASDKASRRLASMENKSLGKNIDDLEKIILTMMQNMNTDDSRLLAKSIHKKTLSKMSRYGLKDRGVKSALFYVLVGARCPAVLIETSFISNPEEEKKLTSPNYQEAMAKSIADGIRGYLEKRSGQKTNL